jgi:hypothetical protein
MTDFGNEPTTQEAPVELTEPGAATTPANIPDHPDSGE